MLLGTAFKIVATDASYNKQAPDPIAKAWHFCVVAAVAQRFLQPANVARFGLVMA